MVIRKIRIYSNFEKEERWLNEMSEQGWMLTSFFFCVYHFTECEPGKYIYRLELLPDMARTAESQKYLRFLEDTGIEVVSTWARWVYYRRNADEGPFDVYSDIDSRITHYKRVFQMLGISLFVLGTQVIYNLSLLLLYLSDDSIYNFAVVHGFILGFCILLFTLVSFPVRSAYRQMKNLQKEKKLRE